MVFLDVVDGEGLGCEGEFTCVEMQKKLGYVN